MSRSPASWLVPALLCALAAARTGEPAETTETDGLVFRVYDRSTGALTAELTAAKAMCYGGVYQLRKVRVTARGEGSLREARSVFGSYDESTGVAELSGGVEMLHTLVSSSPPESARAELDALTWDSRRSSVRSASPVKAAYTRGDSNIAELDATGLSGSAAESSLVFAKLGRLVIHDRARMVGRLTLEATPAEGPAGGERPAPAPPTTVTCNGPCAVVLPARAGRSVELSFVNEVRLVEPEGSMTCDSLEMTLARASGGAPGSAAGAFYPEHARAVGPRFSSGGDSAEAAWAEYDGAVEALLLAGARGRAAVLRRAGQGELAAPRILIDRRARSVTTGGEGDTRLSIKRPDRRAPEEPGPSSVGGDR